MTPDPSVSKAQQEVWEWKEKAYEAIKDLPPAEWIPAIQRQTAPLVAEIRAIIAARKQREAALAQEK